jgi:hypothetical protein
MSILALVVGGSLLIAIALSAIGHLQAGPWRLE